VTMWYHFAFMAVSLALLGLAAGAIAVFLGMGKPERLERTLPVYSLSAAAGVLLALFAVINVPFEPRMTPANVGRLALLYAACAVPFFWGGACMATVVRRLAARMGTVYLFDLAGAGIGCLAVLGVITPLGGPGSVAMVSAVLAAAAVTYAQLRTRRLYLFLVPLAVGLAVGMAGHRGAFDLRYAKERREEGLLFAKWNSYSRVAVYPIERQGTHFFSWGMSPYYDGPTPPQLALDIDAYASTPISRYTGNADDVEYLGYDVTAVGYHLRPGGACAIIGAGGGRDILTALALGQREVVAIEMNPLVIRAVDDVFGEFSGRPYRLPGVTPVADEARSYLRRCDRSFDVIQASLVDTWAATAAGAYALAENGIYTVEAAREFLDRLEPDGSLSFSRFIFDPPRQTLRLVGVFSEALRRNGSAHPELHLAVVKRGRVATTLARRTSFASEEVAKLHSLAGRMGFEEVLMPDHPAGDRFASVARDGAAAPFLESYLFDVSPTTDDRPFFFHMIRPRHFLDAIRRDDLGGQTHNYDAAVILLALLGISVVFVILLVLVPLLARAGGVGKGGASLLYFASIGLGFMLVEIPLIQKYALYLGHPVYSLAVVLFSLLAAGAVGSRLSQGVPVQRLPLGGACVAGLLAIVMVLFLLLHPTLFHVTQGLPKAWRILVTVATLVPLGLLMGVPLPSGVRVLESHRPQLVPWAWGLNSAASVTGAVLAFALALNVGFARTLAVGAALYGVAALLSSTVMREGVFR
jgi:hypothetical protein